MYIKSNLRSIVVLISICTMENYTFCAAYIPDHWNYTQKLMDSQQVLNWTFMNFTLLMLKNINSMSYQYFVTDMDAELKLWSTYDISYDDSNNCTYKNIYPMNNIMVKYTEDMKANSDGSSKHKYFHDIEKYTETLKLCGQFWLSLLGHFIDIKVYTVESNSTLKDRELSLISDLAYFSFALSSKGESMAKMSKATHHKINTTRNHIKELNRNISMLEMLHPLCIFEFTVEFTLFGIGLPAICASGSILFRLVRANRSAPAIVIISLFIADLIHILTRAVYFLRTGKLFFHVEESLDLTKSYFLHFTVLFNVLLMVCISLERYIMVTHPLWFQQHHSIKRSILVCVYTLIGSAIFTLAFAHSQMVVVLYTLPLPLLLFFTVRTWKALVASTSVSRVERNKILGILVVVLATYTIHFLPYILVLIYSHAAKSYDQLLMIIVHKASMYWSHLNCLLDPLLYLFSRSDSRDALCPCWGSVMNRVRTWKKGEEASSLSHTTTTGSARTSPTSTDVLSLPNVLEALSETVTPVYENVYESIVLVPTVSQSVPTVSQSVPTVSQSVPTACQTWVDTVSTVEESGLDSVILNVGETVTATTVSEIIAPEYEQVSHTVLNPFAQTQPATVATESENAPETVKSDFQTVFTFS